MRARNFSRCSEDSSHRKAAWTDCPSSLANVGSGSGLSSRTSCASNAQERVPAEAVSMAVSLDGVMVPMKNGQRQTKRAKAAKEGKYTRGPAGNKEVGCGTLSFYDEEGERLATIRMAACSKPRPGRIDGLAQVREDPQPDPTTSLLPIGVDDGAGPQQGISGGLGTPGKSMARHWSAPRGNPASARKADLVVRHPAVERGERAAWARNAPCPPRTRNQSGCWPRTRRPHSWQWP